MIYDTHLITLMFKLILFNTSIYFTYKKKSFVILLSFCLQNVLTSIYDMGLRLAHGASLSYCKAINKQLTTKAHLATPHTNQDCINKLRIMNHKRFGLIWNQIDKKKLSRTGRLVWQEYYQLICVDTDSCRSNFQWVGKLTYFLSFVLSTWNLVRMLELHVPFQ